MPEFTYQDPFPLGKDTTKYRLLSKEYVSVAKFDGKEILKVDPEGLAFLANQAMRDVSFLLRPAHNEKVAEILSDPAASGQTTLVRFRDFPSGFFWNPWVGGGAIGPFHLAQGFLSPFVALPALLLPEAWIETGVLFLKFNFAFLAAWAFLRSRRFSEAASAAGAAAWAFAHTNLERLELLVAVGNAASQAVALKAGAALEGCLRSRFLVHGRFQDAFVYSLIRPPAKPPA